MRTLTSTGTLLKSDDKIVFNSATDIYFQLINAVGDNQSLSLDNKGAGSVYVLPVGSDTMSGQVAIKLLQYQSLSLLDQSTGLWVVTDLNVLGFDTQLVASPKIISKDYTIFQNLQRVDTYKTVETVKKTIGGIGITADFNFVTAANQTEQIIDLGAIVPAKARILDIMLFTDAVFTGATTLVADVGSSSGGDEHIASATIYAANAILAIAAGAQNTALPVLAASKVYVNATPGANWSNVTAGKVSVYITYINIANL